MESNWRYLIPYTGMTGYPIELMAMQRLSTPTVWGLLCKRSDDGSCVRFLAGPDQLPYSPVGLPKLAPHFPFGYDVYPDSWFFEWPP